MADHTASRTAGGSLSVVLPAFDAGPFVATSIRTLRAALAGIAPQVIVVDDGSTDDTAAQAEAAGADVVISHPRNRGKGAAVRTGFLASTGATVVFTDADLSYSPDQVRSVQAAVEAGADVAIGSRSHPDSAAGTQPGALRRLASAPFNTLTRLAVGHKYGDTQCGLKGFTAEAAHVLARHMRIDGFAFDVELLHLAEHYGMTVVEVPVSVTHGPTSSVRLALHVPQMVRDVVRIRWYESRGLYGDRAGRREPSHKP